MKPLVFLTALCCTINSFVLAGSVSGEENQAPTGPGVTSSSPGHRLASEQQSGFTNPARDHRPPAPVFTSPFANPEVQNQIIGSSDRPPARYPNDDQISSQQRLYVSGSAKIGRVPAGYQHVSFPEEDLTPRPRPANKARTQEKSLSQQPGTARTNVEDKHKSQKKSQLSCLVDKMCSAAKAIVRKVANPGSNTKKPNTVKHLSERERTYRRNLFQKQETRSRYIN